jgi:catechol 2,3-dioxygenase-like lactoylglutathione lyase family enzyme
MFSHIVIGARDLDEAKTFYDAVLAPLGVTLFSDDRADGWLSYRADGARPGLDICRPTDGKPASVGNGVNIGLRASSREAVRRAHAVGLAYGGRSEGEPKLRPHYHANWYGAYLRDPTGNKLCMVCHEAD